jgi:hypothetical protein
MKEGTKYDDGKLRYDLMPPECLCGIVEVLTYGAKKYAPDNWQKVPDAKNRYYAACMRHLEAWRMGQDKDQESVLEHLKHAATCLIFLMWFEIKEVRI